MSKNGQKFILEKKIISQTPIIFASFGGSLIKNIEFKQKMDSLQKKFDCWYLQKDLLEHFEIYGGDQGHVYLHFKNN